MNSHTAHKCLLALTISFFSTALIADSPSLGQSAGEVEALLDSARRVAGWNPENSRQHLRLTGRVEYLGVEETFVTYFAHDGRFCSTFEGELERDVRFDGQGVRLAEFSSLWQDLEFFGRESELLRAWVHSGYWLDPEAPLRVQRAQTSAADGLIGLDIRLRDGLLAARVELDAEDHLVRTLTFLTGNGELRTEYSRHEAVDGVSVAREVRCQFAVGSEVTLEVREARFMDLDDALFDPRPDELDFRFDVDVAPEVEVVQSSSKHLWVRPLVNGKNIGLFLFDTGAGFSGISADAADSLGLSSFGSTSYTGMGGDVTTTHMRRAGTLQLGPLTIDDLVFSEVFVERKTRMVGEKVAGVLGWDVMQRAIVELESTGKLRLYNPSTFELSAGDWCTMSLHHNVPYFSARFADDHQGLFMLDCGAAGVTVAFFHHAAQVLGYLDGNDSPTTTGHGAGGSFEHRLEDLAWFEFAGERLNDLTILVSTAEDGEADPYSLGLIGGGLLRLYRLTFDYSNKRVAIIAK